MLAAQSLQDFSFWLIALNKSRLLYFGFMVNLSITINKFGLTFISILTLFSSVILFNCKLMLKLDKHIVKKYTE